MRTYERNEVTVEQCSGCGGLFLDRGELERLIAAESAFYGAPAVAQAPPPHQPHRQDPPRQQHDDGYDDRHGGKRKKSRKRSFLEEFFD
jgi:Zn-finger nucleic acid-binding protein